MKSSKMIVWLRWDHLPLILEELIQGIRCNEILGQGSRNIGEVPKDFLYTSVLK